MGGSDSSSDSSSSAKKKSKKADKKARKREKKEGKKRKRIDKKGSRRKLATSSGSDSSSPAAKKKRKEKKEKKQKTDSKDEAQQRWIFGREKAIRKAEPDISKEEALRRAVEEYCALYEDREAEGQGADTSAPASKPAGPIGADDIENEHVHDAVIQAVGEAREKARAAGKSEEEVEEEAAKAKEAVLYVAEQNGLYKAPPASKPMSLFLQEKDRQLDEYVRKGMPSTDDRPRSAGESLPQSSLDVTKIRLFPGIA